MPSHLSIFRPFPVKMNVNKSKVASKLTNMSVRLSKDMDTGVITPDIPRIRNVLKIFDPTTFPIARSTFFFLAAIRDVASSGREVPIDKIVMAMIRWETPRFSAMCTAPLTKRRPPRMSPVRPSRIKTMDFGNDYGFILISSASPFLARMNV